VRVSSVGLDIGDDGSTIVRWSEQRPDLQGRIVVCRSVVPVGSDPAVDGVVEGPAEMSARSGVNEYGGGSWWSDGERLHWADGLSGAVVTCDSTGGAAIPLSTSSPTARGWRHAAGIFTPIVSLDGVERRWVICEREVHPGAEVIGGSDSVAGATVTALVEPANELAVLAVSADGGALDDGPATPVTLVRDGDWAVAPTLSPDGATLAWLRWDHPDMPWDSAEVWAARLLYPDSDAGRAVPTVADPRRVAGGHRGGAARGLDRAVAACLPEWSPDGRLWWCDDADDWWQLRCAPGPGLPEEGAGDVGRAALDVPGEVGEPRWVSGGRRYGFTDDGRVVLALAYDGLDSVQVWDPINDERTEVASPPGGFTSVEHLAVRGHVVAVAGGGGAVATSAWTVDLRTGRLTDHRAGASAPSGAEVGASVSLPQGITFPTDGGEQAHALFYPPSSAVAVGADGELPPLIVRIHGGPTASARAEMSASVQFWTTRGFAVADVNYRGSTGYGRRFRDLLRGEWGVVDVADCVAAARWLAAQGMVDGDRCVIRGGSAGGFTALEATCRSEVFAAACSLYGVTDLRALAADTHKFESRYLDGLVGPYPAEAERYRERSPLFHAELLDRPVLLLQGTEDPIVPPSQAEVLREALHRGGVPHSLILFSGEAHGFRAAATIVRAMQAELSFYGEVLDISPADDLPPFDLQR